MDNHHLSIVHVLSSFGMGGQERVALDLAGGQSGEGHRVLTVSLAPEPEGPLAAEFRQRGLEIATVAVAAGRDPRLFLELARLFRQRAVDVVHTHNPQPLLFAALPAKLTRARLVHTKHGVNPDSGRRLAMRRAAGRLVDVFVAVSQPTANVAAERRECRRDRLHVVPNGIDLGRFAPDSGARREIRRELGIPEQAFAVGTVGRLWPEKGHAYLIRSVEPVLGDGFHLVITGEGPERDNLVRQVGELARPDCVHLTGNRRDVPRLLAALDAFVLTSKSEGLPLVIPEAMAAGLPVVSTRVGGIPQVVEEGVTGFMVEYGDEEGLRRRLVALDEDGQLARKCGAMGRERSLDRYSSRRMVADYLGLYRRVVDAK
ncbi:MAG TPA: glycosyltransferase [Kofleriaceae bacterium]|nr:glycosyltransferase [Kofleriaceae bacterium]